MTTYTHIETNETYLLQHTVKLGAIFFIEQAKEFKFMSHQQIKTFLAINV